MLTEVKSVEITKKKIIIVGNNLEEIMNQVDLYKEVEEKEIKFEFDRDNAAHNKYIWKVCQSRNKDKKYKTVGDTLASLNGEILYIANGFMKK